MGNMKANRKFVDGEEAVSAVIGVILMVAITVAIAATVYYYVTTMMPGAEELTPDIIFQKDDTKNVITVMSADPNLLWSNIKVTGDTRGTWPTTTIDAGDTIGVTSEATTISLTWTPTNTLLGTFEFIAG